MLCELHITNLALIERLSLTFHSGLSVLTGETGAGKSIILQAISLLSGGKGAASWVRSGTESATIEALFELDNGDEQGALCDRLRHQGFEAEGTVILKRVLSSQGRSRFYINNSPTTAKVVGEVAEDLFSLASQHDHQQLLIPRYQLDCLDTLGDLWPLRRNFEELYEAFFQKQRQLDELRDRERDKEQRRDFLSFQLNEITSASLIAGEDATLLADKERLKSADELNRLGRKNYSLLYEMGDSFAQLRKNLAAMAALDHSLAQLAEETSGFTFQLEDKVADLRAYLDQIPDDPHLLDEIVRRLDLLSQLKRKYGPELGDVIAHGEQAARELDEIEELDQRLDTLAHEVSHLEEKVRHEALGLSKERQQVARRLSAIMQKELGGLSLEQALFEVAFTPSHADQPQLSRTGIDRPIFMFSANRGEPVKPMAQIASGGELSRLLLALKCLLARKDQVETVIFDEVDTGISGKAAESVARKIRELATHHQVVCITHLPQIASSADEHYRVRKEVDGQRTKTTIEHLDMQQRIGELATMLDGSSATVKTMDYAKELLARNRQPDEP